MSLKARLKFNRPFAFDIAFLILAFLLTAIWPLRIISKPMIDIGGEWAEIHQSLFQATIVFAYLSLFIKKNHYRCFWISIAAGFLLQRYWIFDWVLQPLFIKSGFYQLIQQPRFSGNVQYSKIVVLVPALILQLIRALTRRQDRVRGAINLIYISVVLLVAFLNHNLFPTGVLKDVVNYRAQQLSHIEVFDKNSFRSFCILLNARCRVLDFAGPEVLHDPDFELNEKQASQLESFSSALLDKENVEKIDTNNLLGVYVVKAKVDGTFYEIFDHDYVRVVHTTMLGNFSRNSFLVTWLWQMFLFVLLFLHSTPRLVQGD